MPRKPRIRYEGAIYHAFNRGIDRRTLFMDDQDRRVFLDGLALGVERFTVRIYAYCLMPNHFHLLVETPFGNIDRFMQGVQTRYAGYFNLRHDRSGYVYQGPYRAKLVTDDAYLLKLSRYVHLNPVANAGGAGPDLRAKLKELREYRWSSYREYAGKTRRREWMSYAPTEALIREQAGAATGAYARFVEAGLREDDTALDALLAGSNPCLGDPGPLAELSGRLDRRMGNGLQRRSHYLAPELVEGRVCEFLSVDRAGIRKRRGQAWMRGVLAEMLCRYAGFTNIQTARFLGLQSGAAITIRRTSLLARRKDDPHLDKQMGKIEAALTSLVF